MWSFHVVVLQRTARNVPKCKTHVQSDCFCSLNLLFCGVVVAVAIVIAYAPYCQLSLKVLSPHERCDNFLTTVVCFGALVYPEVYFSVDPVFSSSMC